MRHNFHTFKWLFFIFLFLSQAALAQQNPSPDVVDRLQQAYNKIRNPEISFEKFVQTNRHVYEARARAVALGPQSLNPAGNCNNLQSFCSNGDFESGTIDMSQWLGAYGLFFGVPDPASMTDGFIAGPLTSSSAHQTIVSKGTDPNAGISLTPPDGGNYALRLGNSVNGNGTELIGKRIKVDSSTAVLSFLYAVVFEDPAHAPEDQPAFTVRVFDCATGQELTGVCNLGNGSNKVISNTKNPFFQATNGSQGELIAYRDWTRGEIFLSKYIGKTLTILFVNNDCNLGGHYGYTYLDNFCTSNAFIREPSVLLKGNDRVLNDVDGLRNLIDSTSLNRYGVSADGVTRLVILKQSNKTLTFSLPSANDGLLSTLNDQGTKTTSVDVAPVTNSKGESIVIAIYTAPDSYGTTQALSKNGRPTTLTIREKANPTVKQELSLSIFTPPVVLIHGMWSDPTVWDRGNFYQTLKAAGFTTVEKVDYSTDSYSTFALGNNPAQYPLAVKRLFFSAPKALNLYRNSSIAATQVDVVAHSLGGLMTRSFIQAPEYKANANFTKGYVHKLITLGTPHLGSPLGTFLWNHRNDTIFGNFTISDMMHKLDKDIGTVHKALIPGSADLKSLGATTVKSFSIVGNYKPNETRPYNELNTLIHTIDSKSPALDKLFGEDNDVIVGITSQRGQLNAPFTRTFANTVHSRILTPTELFGKPIINTETNSAAIQDAVRGLLLSDDPGRFAPGFPAPVFPIALAAQEHAAPAAGGPAAPSLTKNDYVKITSPANGTVYSSSSGDSITLEYKPFGNASPLFGIFFVQDIGTFDASLTAPYQAGFRLPKDPPLGRVNITLLALDATGELMGDTASIFIQPSGQTINFAVSPDELVFDAFNTQLPLSVTANVVNGTDTAFADLTSTMLGTTYTPGKGNSIVKVDGEGIVTAVGVGTDSIYVNYQNYEVIVPVTVTSLCPVPKPEIAITGNTLVSSSASGNQWFRNSLPISGATGNSYLAAQPGIYSVQVTLSCTSPMSDPVQITSGGNDSTTTWYRDWDGDGFGDPKRSVVATSQPPGYVSNSDDCNDYRVFYEDVDRDGWGSSKKVPCGSITRTGDCDDNNNKVHSLQTFYRDADGDSWGDPAVTTVVCSSVAPAGFVANRMDCNDSDPKVRYCPATPSSVTKNARVQSEVETASAFRLFVSPNPFAGTTRIQYTVPENAYVTIKLYDVAGREVGTILSGQRTAGSYTQEYNTQKIATGVYVCRMTAIANRKVFTQSQKLTKTH